jgi:hypothetical protein
MNLHDVTGITLYLYVYDVHTSQKTPMGLYGLLQGKLYFVFVDDVRTSQETHLSLNSLLRR